MSCEKFLRFAPYQNLPKLIYSRCHWWIISGFIISLSVTVRPPSTLGYRDRGGRLQARLIAVVGPVDRGFQKENSISRLHFYSTDGDTISTAILVSYCDLESDATTRPEDACVPFYSVLYQRQTLGYRRPLSNCALPTEESRPPVTLQFIWIIYMLLLWWRPYTFIIV